ncbi:glycoside hydrolase [Rhodotorula diobovata]|uniref:Probable beta-glucosidase G n=1 Tax=Rhodotorula diobovata TaxID=5288 RepID=A0A5C5FPD7_9BASI|nr:glycoside hydrolase [Rhodotorula diobovata]
MLANGLVLLALSTLSYAAPANHLTTRKSSSSASHGGAKARSALTADGFTSQKWIDAFDKAVSYVEGMTLEQKINFTDFQSVPNGCSGLGNPLPDIGISQGICTADGPTGINSRYSTQFPAEVTVGATFDHDLIYARAVAMGKEYHTLGAHVPLSICIGPMGRSVYGGRNWETFSPDPYLTGEAARLSVQGFQEQGVVGLVKHFVGNEQEYLRVGTPRGYFPNLPNQTVDSFIDEASLHELYSWPFAEAIRAGSGSFMCAYNQVNGSFACENDHLLNTVLKKTLNFHGWVITGASHWGAGHDTVNSSLHGTDFIGWAREDGHLFGDALAPFVENGTVPIEVVDDKIIRILTPYFALDQASLPKTDFTRYVGSDYSTETARKVTEGALTLLKNVRSKDNKHGLPLHKPRDLLLVGSSAAPAQSGILHNLGFDYAGAVNPDFSGYSSDGYGSGGSPAPYNLDPTAAITARGRKEETPVVVDYYTYDNPTEGQTPAVFTGNGTNYFLDTKLAYSNAAVVFVTAMAREGFDRTDLELLNGGSDLIEYVADRHNDTIVVITAPGPVDMSRFVDHKNVTAILYAYFGGQEGATAIASTLFGDVNPSGKLPFTIARNVSDYPDNYYNGSITVNPVANFTEGVFIDYKHFDAQEIEPLFEFGFGKSYSSFEVYDVAVKAKSKKMPASVRETNEKLFVDDKEVSGLYDVAYEVTAQVKNTGSVAGAEVAQLYLTFPSTTPNAMPPRSLRGFSKPHLAPGACEQVTFHVRKKDLAVWDVTLGGWTLSHGEYKMAVGTSSRKIAETVSVKL